MRVDLRDQWLRNGYVVVGRIFDERRTQELQAINEKILEQWRTNNPETGKPGGGPEATVMHHLNHWGYFDNPPHPLCDLMDAVADEEVLAVGREILGEELLFRCTSLFMNPLENSRDGSWHRMVMGRC